MPVLVRRRLPAFGLLLVAMAALHVLRVVTGHEWFARNGALVAGAIVAWLLIVSLSRDTRMQLLGSASLLVVLVVPEWVESELDVAHRLDAQTVSRHGLPMVAALAAALVLVMLWELARLIRLVSDGWAGPWEASPRRSHGRES